MWSRVTRTWKDRKGLSIARSLACWSDVETKHADLPSAAGEEPRVANVILELQADMVGCGSGFAPSVGVVIDWHLSIRAAVQYMPVCHAVFDGTIRRCTGWRKRAWSPCSVLLPTHPPP